jgi:hypothetical protein
MKYAGFCLVIVGVLMLAVLFFMRITMINALLLIPLLMIITGVLLNVWGIKRETQY